MSENSSSNKPAHSPKSGLARVKHRIKSIRRNKAVKKPEYKWSRLLLLPAWVFISFTLSQWIVQLGVQLSVWAGLPLLQTVNSSVLQTILTALVFLVAFTITFGVPYLFRKQIVTKELLGITRLPSWSDIGLAPLSYIAYALLSASIAYIAVTYVPGFPVDQAQDVGFKSMGHREEYLLAFIALVVVAPIAEELLFRGYLYGKLRARVPLYGAILATSVLFGFIHGQWNLALDTFALSLVLCGLRELTGSIWAGVLLHMLKNAIAFYLTFVVPMTTGIGG